MFNELHWKCVDNKITEACSAYFLGADESECTLDARDLLARQRRGAFAASPVNSVAPKEKKTSGTQGRANIMIFFYKNNI